MKFILHRILVVFLLLVPAYAKETSTTFHEKFYEDLEYAKQTEVQIYVLTNYQVVNLLLNPEQKPDPLTFEELQKKQKPYLVVCVKNLGNKQAYGTLVCSSVPGLHHPQTLSIPTIIEGRFSNYVLSMEDHYYFSKDDVPKISYKWKELYTR